MSTDQYPEMIYDNEWIDKIRSGRKTVTIRRTHYAHSIHHLTNNNGERFGFIEITRSYLVEMEFDQGSLWLNFPSLTKIEPFFILRLMERSGFDSLLEFEQYHLRNFEPGKFVHHFKYLGELPNGTGLD